MNYYSRAIDNDTNLQISPLSNALASMAGPGFEELGGYFLYRTRSSDPNCIEILAQVHSDEAAFQLSRLLDLD